MNNEILIAKQFTPVYDEREDRVRLIFNINYPTRYDMWITRNFLIKLIYSLSDYIIEEEQTAQQNQQSQEKNTIYLPVNKNVELLESFQITPINNSIYLVRFSDNNTTIEAYLSKNDLSKLLKALINATKNTWGISF
jgi:phosphopantetheine adenylyltransferase